MNSISEKSRTSVAHTLLIIGVVASLCFSVGEGLRLLPIPVNEFGLDTAANRQFAIDSHGYSPRESYVPGPLTMPATPVKGIKRQQILGAGNCVENFEAPAVHSLWRQCGETPPSYRSLRRSPRHPGRAPPPPPLPPQII